MTTRRDRHGSRVAFVGAVLLLFLLVMSVRPDLSGPALLALMVVLLVAGAGYQVLEAIRALRRRTRLTIAEILSDGRPRDRIEVAREVHRRIPSLRFPPLRWLGLHDRALAELTRRGLLALRDGRYSSTQPGGARSRS